MRAEPTHRKADVWTLGSLVWEMRTNIYDQKPASMHLELLTESAGSFTEILDFPNITTFALGPVKLVEFSGATTLETRDLGIELGSVFLPPGTYYLAINTDGVTDWTAEFGVGAAPGSAFQSPDGVLSWNKPDKATAFSLFGQLHPTPGPLEAEIELEPGDDTNRIDPVGRGVVAVAIIGSTTFDVSDVDVTTLAFVGPNGATPAPGEGGHFEDVNDDGLTDLVSHYATAEAGISLGDTEACVTGELLNDTRSKGATTSGPCRWPAGLDSSSPSFCRR